MIALALKASLLLLIAAGIDLLLRGRASASARHLLWSATILSLLLLPLCTQLMPSWQIWMREVVVSAPEHMNTSLLPAAWREVAWQQLIVWGYFAVAAWLLVGVLRDHLVAWRITRRCQPVRDVAWLELLARTRDQLGVTRDVRLIESDAAVVPLTLGMVRPAILLPARASEWPYERRRAVLLHELAHVARYDCCTQTLAAITCALYWLHPGAWFAARRLRIEREIACDDLAVTSGFSAHDYARHLLEIAHRYRSQRLSVAVNMATHPVERRLHAIIDNTRPRHAPRRRVTFAAIAGATLVVLPLAAAVSGQQVMTPAAVAWHSEDADTSRVSAVRIAAPHRRDELQSEPATPAVRIPKRSADTISIEPATARSESTLRSQLQENLPPLAVPEALTALPALRALPVPAFVH